MKVVKEEAKQRGTQGASSLAPTWAVPVAPALPQIMIFIVPPLYNDCMAASFLP